MGKNGVRIRNFDDGGKFPESFEDYKKQIEELLPHREPMLLIDELNDIK